MTNEKMNKIKQKFFTHRHRTEKDGRVDAAGNLIKFQLTFSEWFTIWSSSGLLDEHLTNPYVHVMARTADLGHYVVGNVTIKLRTQNTSEGRTGKKHTKAAKDKMATAKMGKQYRLGANQTDDTKAKQSSAASGEKECSKLMARGSWFMFKLTWGS